MVEQTNTKIVEAIIFSSKFNEVLLVSTDEKYWNLIQVKSETDKNHLESLNNYIHNLLGQIIFKNESWKQVCEIINLEKTRTIYLYMTIVSNLELFTKCNNIKTRIFKVSSLNFYDFFVPTIWKIYLSIDQHLNGNLSRLVYYS